MRLTPIALSAAIILATVASAGFSQKPDSQIDPRSVALTQQADALNAQGHYSEATGLLETALAVDPRNRSAYIGLARAAQGEKMYGEAIKFYFDALKLEPNDVNALAGQGEALVQRGAVERARQNLDRIHSLCRNPCPQATQLAAAIAKGPPPAVVTAERPEPASPRHN
ncbi:MAG TPA: tetratricopeptide repeat protein [Allosphingosinicella sp.]|nr:tetratricopeptide repeat protein [Allosphingosinicella sp.]